MLDVGWTELVVIAIVMIIVVGPKDLPPMLRTFGKMMTKMRGMAGDFRQQFDEALKEADLDEVRKTISDVKGLNPTHSLREAMNPLRQMGNDIKADLQKATSVEPKPATPPADATPVAPVVASEAVLPAAQPLVDPAAMTLASASAMSVAGSTEIAKPKAKRVAKSKATTDAAVALKDAPKKPRAAKPAGEKTAVKATKKKGDA